MRNVKELVTSNTETSLNKNGNIEKKLKSGELNFQNISLPVFSELKKYLILNFVNYIFVQVVNYTADPELGFHAEGAGVPEYPH